MATDNWYALSTEDVLQRLQTDAASGLTAQEVERRREQYGTNELPREAGTPPWKILLSQFTEIMVIVLVVAAVISILIGDSKDAIVIMAIVVLNAALGFFQEYQAEQALASLSEMQTPIVRVRREGHVQEMSAVELVPGDIVLLEAGDRIPADGRLLEAVNLQIDESALTGESSAVEKDTAAMEDCDPPPALADRTNVAYMGTAVTYGRGLLVVTGTGLKTQLGNIASMLQQVEKGRTPLQERLEKVGLPPGGRGAGRVCAGVRRRRGARRGYRRNAADGDQPGRGGDPRRSARRDHDRAGAGRPAHDPAARADPQAAGGRNARLGVRDLLGQDRHADAQRNDRDADRAARTRRCHRARCGLSSR